MTDKAGAGRGEETADSVTRRPEDSTAGGAERGNTHSRTRSTEGLLNIK